MPPHILFILFKSLIGSFTVSPLCSTYQFSESNKDKRFAIKDCYPRQTEQQVADFNARIDSLLEKTTFHVASNR